MFFLMLLAGIRMEPLDFARTSRSAIFVALGGMAVPFAAGLALGGAVIYQRVHDDSPRDAIGMFLTASVAGYMISSFFSGFLLARVGVGRILAASCLLTGLALIGYTLVPEWWMMYRKKASREKRKCS